MKPIRPKKLKKKDLIGIISPASPISDLSRLEKGVRYLEGLGYRVVVGSNVGKVHGYLGGDDASRVADIHAMFEDKKVKAIFCLRGGYGTPRLLPLLDYDLIARHSKIFVGYSDITALQLAFWRKCNLITFHGPMVGPDLANSMDDFTESLFWEVLTSSKKIGKIAFPEGKQPSLFNGGRSEGRLLGGNLSLVVSLLGTRYQPEYKDAILFLEEIGEEPYRVDRMLMQLKNAGIFKKAAGVLMGQFSDCLPEDAAKPSLTVQDLFMETAAGIKRPFLANLPFGHVSTKITLPVGLKVRVDGSEGEVTFLEAAVG